MKLKVMESKYAVFIQSYKSSCAQEGNQRLGQYFTGNCCGLATYVYLVSPSNGNILIPHNREERVKQNKSPYLCGLSISLEKQVFPKPNLLSFSVK